MKPLASFNTAENGGDTRFGKGETDAAATATDGVGFFSMMKSSDQKAGMTTYSKRFAS